MARVAPVRQPVQRTASGVHPVRASTGAAIERAETVAAGVAFPQHKAVLPSVDRTPALELVQRRAAVSTERGAVDQMVGGSEALAEMIDREEEPEMPDLDQLARQVYPIIKRMLSVERERRLGRWR